MLAQPEAVVLGSSPDAVGGARRGAELIQGLLNGVNSGVLVHFLEILAAQSFMFGLLLILLVAEAKLSVVLAFACACLRLSGVAVQLVFDGLCRRRVRRQHEVCAGFIVSLYLNLAIAASLVA